MTIDTRATHDGRRGAASRSGLLLAGLGVAVGLRLLLGGAGAQTSPAAGLAFAAALLMLTWAAWPHLPQLPQVPRLRSRWRPAAAALGVGLAGAALLCAPVVLTGLGGLGVHRPAGSFASWAVVVTIVALAEEALLRGALYAHVEAAAGPVAAIVVSAAAFAALHVPLYGWRAAGFDLAVGVVLGVVRRLSGTWVAPGITHVVADLAGWWLR